MFATFTAIFEALTAIESELATEVSDTKRERLIETLLSLRRTMDKCVQYWLQFEERVNEIQERFSISLPDTLPPGFLEDIDLGESSTVGKGEPADVSPELVKEKINEAERKEDEAEPGFYKSASEITITSFRRALGFWELAMLKEAVDEFKKVVEEEPNLIMGHFCLGLSSAQLGKVEEAFRELKLVLALDQNQFMRALALNTLGIIQAGKEQYQQAQNYFSLATEADPELGEAWFNLAATSYNTQNYPQAIDAFAKAKEFFPEDWELDLYLGRSMAYLGRYAEAAEALERAFTRNPHEPLVTFELGLVYRLMGKQGVAQSYFHATLKLMESKK